MKMMDHQHRENCARNTYSNFNQMTAYVECSSNQSKKSTLSTFHGHRENFEDSGKVLVVSVSEFYESTAVAHAYKMVITTVCVQTDNCFCNT